MKLRGILKWGVTTILGLLLAGFGIAYLASTNECYDSDRPAPAHPMRAIVYCDYGPPDVLRVEAVEKPVPGERELLVRVRAVALNPLDWHYVRGTPYVMRLGTGLRRPKSIRFGVDYAGTIEAVGAGVTKFKPGDAVFGGRNGAFAEYLTTPEDAAVALKPGRSSFEEAASLPIAAITALQGLRDQGRVGAGDRVLVNGASGGVGTFAVQIAKALGAHVTGVCSTRNVDLVRSLGADAVVDYTKEDFAAGSARYDVILDNVGTRPISDFRGVLAENGRYVLIGGGGLDDQGLLGPVARMARAAMIRPFVDEEILPMMARMQADDLVALADLIESGKVTPVIDRRYSLEEFAEAMRYLETGRARGKVVVALE